MPGQRHVLGKWQQIRDRPLITIRPSRPNQIGQQVEVEADAVLGPLFLGAASLKCLPARRPELQNQYYVQGRDGFGSTIPMGVRSHG